MINYETIFNKNYYKLDSNKNAMIIINIKIKISIYYILYNE